MGDYIRELAYQPPECPECGNWHCTFDHDAESYDSSDVNDPSAWPPWYTRKDAKMYHDEMMHRKAGLGG